MSKGYEGVQNDSYRYCREAIWWAFKQAKNIICVSYMLALEAVK